MKGSVYKIYCKDSSITEFYVGSSCDFHQRKRKHKSSCNNPKDKQYNYKVYRYIRNNGGFDNWDFEILLETEVENNKELKLKYEKLKNNTTKIIKKNLKNTTKIIKKK
jgi:hypothetical protein